MKKFIFYSLLFLNLFQLNNGVNAQSNPTQDTIVGCSDNIFGLGAIYSALTTWTGGLGSFDPNRGDPLANYTPHSSEYGTTVILTYGSYSVQITILKSPDLIVNSGLYYNSCPDTAFDLASINIIDAANTNGSITYHDNNFNLLGTPFVSPPIGVPTIYYIFKTTSTNPACFDFESVVIMRQACAACSLNSPTATVQSVSCSAGGDGFIDVSVTGGTPPYTYTWSNGTTTQDIFNLSAGLYTITVTDSDNCVETKTFQISEPQALVIVPSIFGISVPGTSTGQATLTVSGGITPYSYLWSDGQTTQTATGLARGTYDVTVTDDNGCTYSTSVRLGMRSAVATQTFYRVSKESSGKLSVYPNPSTQSFNVNLAEFGAGRIKIRIFDLKGKVVESLESSSSGEPISCGGNLLPGVYILQVNSTNRITQTRILKSK